MPQSTSLVSIWLTFATTVIQSDLFRHVSTVFLDRWRSSRFAGTYTVVAHHSTLELKDSKGHVAVYTKHQQLTFVQNNVFAIQDQAWGDGNIFASYTCSPGEAVDRYKEGYRYKILISLRGTRNKGDQETLTIQRKIEDGFTTSVGNFQTQIDHPTDDLTVSVIFPRSRPPRQVTLIQQNLKRDIRLGNGHLELLPDGRTRYHWQTRKPHLYEGYIIRWEW